MKVPAFAMRKAFWGVILAFLVVSLTVIALTPVQTSGGGLEANLGIKVDLTVKYYAHDARYADLGLVLEGYSPSCWVRCDGILYTEDPTVHVTNNGIDFLQCLVGHSSGSITCVSTDETNYLSVSASSGHVPAFTDTSCPGTVATTDGFSIAAGTITAGVPASGSVVWQVSYTWTAATAATSSLDLACIQTEASGGAHIVLFADGQIASTSVNPGDTLETIWQVTYSSS